MVDQKTTSPTLDFCGLVMPISEIDGCSETHWLDVKAILTEAVEGCGLKVNLVSNADEVGVIQQRIIENLYSYPIIVCDVSGKNPNVMFELGLRLAFDKPVIIVKDDRTGYSFDTGPIEHLTYPRDLRFARIVEFQRLLAGKVSSTLQTAKQNANYSPFLKAFGEFSLPKVTHKEIGSQEFIMQQLDSINLALSRLTRDSRRSYLPSGAMRPRGDADMCALRMKDEDRTDAVRQLQSLAFVDAANRYLLDEDHEHIAVFFKHPPSENERKKVAEIAPRIRYRKVQ